MAESEEAKRSESVLGAELQFGESSSRRTREGVEERIQGLQFSSDEEGGGRGGPVLRDSEGGAPSPTPPLQTQGGADDELDGAPVIRADDEEEEEEEEDDWDMDTGETPDCAVDMETDKRVETDKRPQSDRRAEPQSDRRTEPQSDRLADTDRRTEPQSDRLAGERSRPQNEGSDTGAPAKTPAPGLGTAFISADARRPPVADVEMSAVEESVGDRRVQDTPLPRATDPSLAGVCSRAGGVVLSQCGSRGSRRQGEDTPVSISPPQPGVLRIREMESGSVEGGCFFPPVDIKDEPIDEEYDRALVPQPPPRRIKDEPDASEDLVQQQKTSEELRISSVFSVGENSSPPTGERAGAKRKLVCVCAHIHAYTTWPKVCGHLISNQNHPKLWALIWSWSTLCCYNNLHSSGKALN
ncbi:proline-, glutamic acid- and leucine-rich protein 1-like isoform X6 [Anguilla rostrata]|uniref:proline-, glutamic acid- and leucine-rich protein 1-like isoform X6 n=1 Tax=Anguilla rostrata TaxID=7938 RepID=UPI0030CDE4E3